MIPCLRVSTCDALLQCSDIDPLFVIVRLLPSTRIMEVIATLTCAAMVTVLYTLYGVVYRLFLSPVAKFPGSRLAAVTFWYEFYFDVVKGGQYMYEIERMHKQYGKSDGTHGNEPQTESPQGPSFESTHTSCTSTTPTWTL